MVVVTTKFVFLESSPSIRDALDSIDQAHLEYGKDALGYFLLALLQPQHELIQDQLLLVIENNLTVYPPFIQGHLRELLHFEQLRFYPKQAIIINCLGRLQFSPAEKRLREILQDGDMDIYVRGAAAEALGELGINESLSLLQNLLNDPYEPDHVRSSCAIALGWLRNDQAIDTLLHVFRTNSENSVWRACLDALHNFNDPSVNLVLFEEFARYQEGAYRSHLKEIFLKRNLIPLIFLVKEIHLNFLGELFLYQGLWTIPLLEQARTRPGIPQKFQDFIASILNQLRPEVSINQGYQILL